jgi:hypothetical protein
MNALTNIRRTLAELLAILLGHMVVVALLEGERISIHISDCKLTNSSWCGVTTDHCLPTNGCQSGCTGASVPIKETTSVTATTDGTCGAANGGTVCGTWNLGSCCSMYGFW